MIAKKHWQAALDVQSACNLSGVVFSFAEAMHAICDEQNELREGTAWKNEHPIARLFAEQIAHLTRGREYFEADKIARKAVEGG